MFRPLPIERSSTVERVVDALRNEILTGELAPGTPLPEVSLAASMGVARGTLRIAIATLVNEGLVRRSPYKSLTVTRLTQDDISDIFAARRLIEFGAIDAAGGKALEALRESVDGFAEALNGGGSDDGHAADVRVHAALVALAGSERISRAHEALMGELRIALTPQYRRTDEGPELVRRHREFLELLENGQGERAKEQLGRRLAEAERRLLSEAPASEDG